MRTLTCIVCPIGCSLLLEEKNGEWSVDGNLCPKGRKFALDEATHPMRTLTSTVRTTNPEMPRLPVRTDGEIPKALMPDVMELINRTLLRHSTDIGEVIIGNVLDTGVNIISTCETA